VEARSGQAEFIGTKNLLHCSRCVQGFETTRLLNWHERKCRRPEATYIKIKKDSSYPCGICQDDFATRFLFKRHLFDRHSEVEVKGCYQRDLEAVIGSYTLRMFRQPLFTAIATGKWELHIGRLMQPKDPVDIKQVR
jgi:hypothetical protein